MLILLPRVCLWPLLALLLVAKAARADSAQILTLDYGADPSCPDEARFREELSARVTRPLVFADQAATRVLRVRLHADASGVAAELLIESAGQPPSLREFRTASCEDALRAVALVAALAIDPNASLAADPRAAAFLPPPPRPVRGPALLSTPRTPPPADASVAASPVRVELGPLLGATLGPSPSLLSSAGLQLGLETGPRTSIFAARFALSLLVSRSGVLSPSVSEGTFGWSTSRVAACPLRLALGLRSAVRPCWITDLGVLTARGNREVIENPETAVRPWLASGLALLLQHRMRRFVLGAGVGALAALTRDHFVFLTPDARSVHEVPNLAWTAELGLGILLGGPGP